MAVQELDLFSLNFLFVVCSVRRSQFTSNDLMLEVAHIQ